MAQKKFLVTGATGDTGGYTVEQLLELGHAVRALAHREDDRSKRLEKMGAEVVFGDFLKFNDVRVAMRGVRGAYFCYPIRPGILQATAYFAQAAKEAGLECVEPGAILTGRQRDFCRTWRNQTEVTVKGIHFVQEDSPEQIGQALAAFVRSLRSL
jgi:NADPH:quinone reductase-like Zn-dependent oxidoreductase